MKKKAFIVLIVLCITSFTACLQNNRTADNKDIEVSNQRNETIETEPHRYGGWYCPDNLNGFPAVDIRNWESVPVVNGRMATKEETQNGTSLILVDDKKYPDARPLDIKMPKLARYYNYSSGKKEIIIIIQALKISNDSVVGFRYLNGGNGSARLNEVKFLSDNEIENISSSRFITLNVEINASKVEIWEVMTEPEYNKTLQAVFDKENTLKHDWKKSSKVNFKYLDAGIITSEFAGNLYGNQYIQIDCEYGDYQYVEKFLLSENEQINKSNL